MKWISICVIVLLSLAAEVSAQVQAGDTSLNLSGTASGGYNGDYSNSYGSDHSFAFGGTGDLSGSYYNPNFLSFDLQPFYNQSRVNSSFQSITDSSGVNASLNLFREGHFPGSIVYTRTFNNSGNYQIPGASDFTTQGDSENLGINWGIRYEGFPTLNLGYSDSNNSYSVFGADGEGSVHANTFTATSTYYVGGFHLNGGYQHTGMNSVVPDFLSTLPSEDTHSGSNAFSLGVGHNLPLKGSFSVAATRSTLTSDLDSTGYKTTLDSVNSGVNFDPIQHLNFGATASYVDNLDASIYNSLVASGAILPQILTQSSSTALNLNSFVNYDIPRLKLHLQGFADRQEESFVGLTYISNVYNGTATYSNELLGGEFNGTVGVNRSSLNTSGQANTGLIGSVNYTRSIRRLQLAGSFGYSQDTQTILAAYTTSGYNYSGSVGYKFSRRTFWSVNTSGARSLLTDQPGTASSSQTYSTTLVLPKITVSGNYSKADGNALLTSGGLVPTPVPQPAINPFAIVLYSGKAYSAAIGSSPIHGLTLSASYSNALSDTLNNGFSSKNDNETFNALLVYQVRKLNFTAGYIRLTQGFSLSGLPPSMVGSYYFGISRWFKVF